MNGRVLNLLLRDEAAQQALGARLAASCPPSAVVYLNGDLGTGKTTLVRGLLWALGHDGSVKSPTYTLLEPYRIGAHSVYHLDLYRLASPDELDYLGLRDLLADDALFFVEWADIGRGALPPADLDIALTHDPAGRRLQLRAMSACGEAWLAAFEGVVDGTDV